MRIKREDQLIAIMRLTEILNKLKVVNLEVDVLAAGADDTVWVQIMKNITV